MEFLKVRHSVKQESKIHNERKWWNIGESPKIIKKTMVSALTTSVLLEGLDITVKQEKDYIKFGKEKIFVLRKTIWCRSFYKGIYNSVEKFTKSATKRKAAKTND